MYEDSLPPYGGNIGGSNMMIQKLITPLAHTLYLTNIPGTVVLYDFSQNTGSVFTDLSGNGRHLTKNAAATSFIDRGTGLIAWNASNYGMSYYISDQPLKDLLRTQAWSATILLKRTSTPAWGWVWSFSNNAPPISWLNLAAVFFGYGTGAYWGQRPAGTATNFATDGIENAFITLTVVAIPNGGGAGVFRYKLYRNGVYHTYSDSTPGSDSYYGTDYLCIGGAPGVGEWQPGIYAGFRVLNYAMSDAQVAEMASLALP